MLTREELKLALFQDDVMASVMFRFGLEEVRDELRDFRSDLRLQLNQRDEGDSKWTRGVVSLIIRCKSRMKEIDKGVWGS